MTAEACEATCSPILCPLSSVLCPPLTPLALVIQCKAPDMRASEWNILGERASSPFTIGAAHLPFRTGKMPVSQYRPRYSEIMALWHFAIMESLPSIPQSHNLTIPHLQNSIIKGKPSPRVYCCQCENVATYQCCQFPILTESNNPLEIGTGNGNTSTS